MTAIKFFDENTRNWWYPETGGANIPALNELLATWGVRLGTHVFDGHFSFRKDTVAFRSGNALDRFPLGGLLFSAQLNDLGQEIVHRQLGQTLRVPILGLLQVSELASAGRVVVFGDSSCADDAHSGRLRCDPLLAACIDYAATGWLLPALESSGHRLDVPFASTAPAPERAEASTLHIYSTVLEAPGVYRALPQCQYLVQAETMPLHNGSAYDALLRRGTSACTTVPMDHGGMHASTGLPVSSLLGGSINTQRVPGQSGGVAHALLQSTMTIGSLLGPVVFFLLIATALAVAWRQPRRSLRTVQMQQDRLKQARS